MDEPFMIPVQYRGKELEFEAGLHILGYTHRFHVHVDGTNIIFERDEEGEYRALIPEGEQGKPPAMELLAAIAEAIRQILK